MPRVRLSAGGGEAEDRSSVATSTSNVNNQFKNTSLLPRLATLYLDCELSQSSRVTFLRFDDQVEFKIPRKFDDGFQPGPIMEEDTEAAAPAAPRPSAAKPRSASPGRALLGRLQKRSLEPSPLARATVEDETRPAPAPARPAAKTSGAKASSAGSAAGDHNSPLMSSVLIADHFSLLAH